MPEPIEQPVTLDQIANTAAAVITLAMKESLHGKKDYAEPLSNARNNYDRLCRQYVTQLLKANLAVKRFENIEDLK